jgi:hypothetical protein
MRKREKAGALTMAIMLVGILIGLAWKSEIQAGQIERLQDRIESHADSSMARDTYLFEGLKGHFQWHESQDRRGLIVPRTD